MFLKSERRSKPGITFRSFLNGTPARDYVFQDIPYEEQLRRIKQMFESSDAILIGAGAGLSSAAGLTYGGDRFKKNFKEFIEKYGEIHMTDMYSAGFYPFPTEEERWAYWSKHADMNRIQPEGLPLYQTVHELVQRKEHFVLTTNVDHQFQKSGFADEKVFATQGDYGLIQCMHGCHKKTYDAIPLFHQMNQARRDCKIPSYLVPKCPVCGGSMAMNLRCDQYFVEDENWKLAEKRFGGFLTEHIDKKLLLLELGVGFNTPTIVRFPFEKLVRDHENICLVRLNLDEAVIPQSMEDRAVGINADMLMSINDIADCMVGIR